MTAAERPDAVDGLADDIRALLLAGQDVPHVVALLTDEELMFLEDADERARAPHPWLEQQPDVSTDLAGRFGMRSLLARSAIVPQRDGGGPSMLVQRRMRIAVGTRRVGLGVVRADRTAQNRRSSRIVVVQPEIGVFEEDVSVDGFHLFSTCSYTAAAERLGGWVLQPTVGAHAAGQRQIDVREWGDLLLAELGDDIDVVTLTLSTPETAPAPTASPSTDSPEELGDGQSWVVANDGAVALLARPVLGSPGRLAVESTSTESLTAELGRHIRPADPAPDATG